MRIRTPNPSDWISIGCDKNSEKEITVLPNVLKACNPSSYCLETFKIANKTFSENTKKNLRNATSNHRTMQNIFAFTPCERKS